jgi:hypothetical protein
MSLELWRSELRSIDSGTFFDAGGACLRTLLLLLLCSGCLLPDAHLAQPVVGTPGTSGHGGADAGDMSGPDAGAAGAKPAEPTRDDTSTGGKTADAGKTANAGRSADAGTAGAAGSSANAGESATAGTSADAGESAAGGMSANAGRSGAGAAGQSADAGKSGAAGNSANAGESGAAGKSPTAAALPVSLGTAASYVILAKSGISTVPTSAVTGNIGVSPIAATAITGFSLIVDSTHVFSTSSQVTGKVYAADYAPPTASNLTTAVLDMQLAFADAAGRAPDVTELNGGNLGGMTLARGIYRWSTGLLIPTNVTLTGSATDVWIFQIAKDLTMSGAAKILLAGGALPKNIFWQVSGLVDLGTTAHCEGVVLTQTAVTLRTGASINGRLLAQTAVNIDSSTVVAP